MVRRTSRLPISHHVSAAPMAARPRVFCAYCSRALSDADAEQAREHRMSTREIAEHVCGCRGRRYSDGDGGENFE